MKSVVYSLFTFYRAMLCIARTLLSQDVPLSVRPSVTRRYSIETAKHVIKRFSPSGSHSILVFFPHQIVWRVFRRGPPNGGADCKGVWENRVGHGSLFQNPTQPNQKFMDPTQPTKVSTRPNPTHHRHLVWHIRLHWKLYTATVTRHRQVLQANCQWKLLFSCSTH